MTQTFCGDLPIRNTPLYYAHQYIDETDIAAVVEVLRSDYLTCGPKIAKLEHRLCELTNAGYSVAVSNGTAALHAACYAAGIRPGDEVITTPITFAASANCIRYCEGIPVFADIDPHTYNISPKAIEQVITDKTKAVIAVDFTGQAVELDAIRAICDAYKLVLIEDAAHSIGTKYRGQAVGGIADLTTFSFHPVKTVTGGEGGAVLTNRSDFAQRLMLFRSHGITRDERLFENTSHGSWYYEQLDLGMNYRMTDFQAALILSQLKKLDMFSQRRREIVAQYNQAFSELPELILQQEIPESDTTRHLYLLRLNSKLLSITRQEFIKAMADRKIICNVHYIPVYWHPYYQSLGYQKGICPEAERLYEEMVTIPLYFSMQDEDVAYVIQNVKDIVRTFSNR